MSSRPELKLDWCSYEAAKYAVEHWHYSRAMPSGKTVRIGIWEGGRFIGVIIFSLGAIYHIARPFGLKNTEVCELTRVALTTHVTPVTRMLAIAVKMLKSQSPGLRLVVSYADSKEGHHGGIYQGAGWIYLGQIVASWQRIKGKVIHPRTVFSRYGSRTMGFLRSHVDPQAERVQMPPKYKYALPLDSEMHTKLLLMAQPYPKRAKDSSEPAAIHAAEGGAAPTRTLQELDMGLEPKLI